MVFDAMESISTRCSGFISSTLPLSTWQSKRTLKKSTSQFRRFQIGQTKMASAIDEVKHEISESLDMGKVTSLSRAGSSGWAVMHRATTEQGKQLFIKVSRDDVSMFKGEEKGLWAMHETQTIRVPKPYLCGALSSTKGSYIIMEALDLVAVYSQVQLGTMLARMHLASPVFPEAQQGKFGFCVDNTIGATPQPNGWMDNWIDFFRDRRLFHQLKLTGDPNLIEKGEKLCRNLHVFFHDIKDEIKPSLIHGDLWSGNISGVGSVPAIFDPACYYGHHEAEFGMSWCAGLNSSFWDAYHEVIPRQPGFSNRHKLYQLYHYLNHCNLFGGGYYNMSEMLLNDLLSEI